jgi:uncharacterized protein YqeY
MRTELNEALKEAIKGQDKIRAATLRLVMAAVKDRDIAARTDDNREGVSDTEIIDILSKMVRQRVESATTYDDAGRADLADRERAEIEIIQGFLPAQLSEAEIIEAVAETIAALEAASLKDMGRVMAALKEAYAGQMDFGRAGVLVKEKLGA